MCTDRLRRAAALGTILVLAAVTGGSVSGFGFTLPALHEPLVRAMLGLAGIGPLGWGMYRPRFCIHFTSSSISVPVGTLKDFHFETTTFGGGHQRVRAACIERDGSRVLARGLLRTATREWSGAQVRSFHVVRRGVPCAG